MENDKMIFDFAMGNPPYQKMTSETSCTQVWPGFIDLANALTKQESSLVHPAKWVSPKAQMVDVRDNIIKNNISDFDYYAEAKELFPDVNITGGITLANYDKLHTGDSKYCINGKRQKELYNKDTVVMDEWQKQAYNLVFTKQNNYTENMLKRVRGRIGTLGVTADFGYDRVNHMQYLKDTKKGLKNPIKVWSNNDIARGSGNSYNWYYIDKSKIKEIPSEILQTRKVMLSKAGNVSGNCAVRINGEIQIIDKNIIGSCIHFIIPEIDTDYDLKLIQSLFCTKTARFLMSIIQKDQYVRGFEMIPDYLYFKEELEQMGKVKSEVRAMLENEGYKYWIDPTDKQTKAIFSDKYFYDKFGFSQKLIDYIESHISPKEIIDEIVKE